MLLLRPEFVFEGAIERERKREKGFVRVYLRGLLSFLARGLSYERGYGKLFVIGESIPLKLSSWVYK